MLDTVDQDARAETWLDPYRAGRPLFAAAARIAAFALPGVRTANFLAGAWWSHLQKRAVGEALWRHWGEPRSAWYNGSHLSFQREPEVHALLREALSPALFAEAA